MSNKNLLLKPKKVKKTTLDIEYHNLICNLFNDIDETIRNRWDLYDLIINNIKKTSKKDYINELKYRITDGENANKIILDIIDKESDNIDNLVWSLKKRIEDFLEEDFFNSFLI